MALQFQQPNIQIPNKLDALSQGIQGGLSLVAQHKALKKQQQLAELNHQIAIKELENKKRELESKYGTGEEPPTKTDYLSQPMIGTPGSTLMGLSNAKLDPFSTEVKTPLPETDEQLIRRIGTEKYKLLKEEYKGQTKGTGTDDKAFSQLQQLRTTFENQSKDFKTINGSYGRLMSTSKNPSPAGDLSMLFNYMKMLDPGSVVRESEFASATTAAPLMTRLGMDWEKIKGVWEGERMTPEMRADFLSQAKNIYGASAKAQKKLVSETRRIAIASNLDPDLAVIDLFTNENETSSSVSPNVPKVGVVEPDEKTGENYRFLGGDPADRKNWEKIR